MKTQFTDKKRRAKAAKQASNAILPKRDTK